MAWEEPIVRGSSVTTPSTATLSVTLAEAVPCDFGVAGGGDARCRRCVLMGR